MQKLWQMSKAKMGEESIKSMKSHMQKVVILNAHICVQGGGEVEKPVIRYVRTTWMAPNKCCEFFFRALVQSSKLEHQRQQGKCRSFLPS